MSLVDLDNITIGTICELIEEHNLLVDKEDGVIEATPEILDRF